MNPKIILIAAMFSCLTVSAQTIKVEKLDKAKLPVEISYKGKVKEAVRYTDNSGEYLVLISQTGEYRDEKREYMNDDSRDAELYAYCFAVKGSTYKQVWRVYDFIHDCPVDIVASFIDNTLQVTDLDNDGIAEVWIMYRTACHGDVSPCDMKVIMYEGKQKYAMRGTQKIVLEDASYGGDYKFDSAFDNGPKAFRDFAEKLWNKNLIMKFE